MKRFSKRISILALTASVLALSACAPAVEKEAVSEATVEVAVAVTPEAVHQAVITLDTHVDIPLTYMTDAMDPGTDTDAQVDLAKMEVGGLDAAFFIVYTPQTNILDADIKYAEAREIAETRFAAIDKLTKTYPERIELAKTADDVRRIHKSGKRAALIGMENAFPLGASVDDVPLWAERGVRYMGITHMGHNQFGDSSNPKTAWGETDSMYGGLSPLGKDLVAALNKAGIMVDVSHAGRETMMQATALSSVPVIASHSGVMGVADSLRNLDDAQLRALAENGGVAQMVALGSYVKALSPAQEKFKADVRTEMGFETDTQIFKSGPEKIGKYFKALEGMYDIDAKANVADFADHIDHAVKIAGIDHVGIASDFDGGGGITGWSDASETLNITKELVKRGYSQTDIEKIWGGNLLRVLQAVQDGADK